MKTKIQITIIATVLLLFSVTNVSAQSSAKYSYATVSQFNTGKKIIISMTGKETIEIKFDYKGYYEYSAALNEVKKLTDEGWELLDTNSDSMNLVFVLRKKEN